jgi:hypothetical protein
LNEQITVRHKNSVAARLEHINLSAPSCRELDAPFFEMLRGFTKAKLGA